MANWYVRKGGADTNGGSSNSLTPDRSGTDMGVTNASTQVTSASGAFVGGDVGKGIMIATVLYRIATVTNGTTIQLERVYAGTTGSNRAWAIGGALLTIGKLLQTAAAIMQNGDTLWIGAGTYREVVTPTMTNLTATGYIRGDVDGVQTGDPGEVRWTAYTTNDKTAQANSAVLILNTRNFLTFQNIVFVGGNQVVNTTATSHDITFSDCAFLLPNGNAIYVAIVVAAGVAANWTIQRCLFVGIGGGTSNNGVVHITLARHTADYNVNIAITNCVMMMCAAQGVRVMSSGSGTGFGGGIAITNCTILAPSVAVITNDANLSTTFPVTVNNCILGVGQLNANVLGEIIEDYNLVGGGTPRVNVTAGAHSQSQQGYALLMEWGQAFVTGSTVRPTAMPVASSPVLGFGAAASPPATDILGATRPAGGASASNAIGAYERANTFGKETGTVRTGSNAISITGPGYQDFALPVAAASTAVTVYVRWDATYAGTKPAMSVLNGTECGVANATATATGSSGAWEQLSLNFTPTAAGIVTIRFVSSDTNGGGKMFVDDFAVSR